MKVYNLILAFLIVPFVCFSQESIGSLSMEEAINLALENNYDIKISENNKEILDNNAVKANANYLPSISFSGSYNYQNQSVYSEFASDQVAPIDRAGAGTQSINAGLNLNYTIYSGGSRKYTFERLKNESLLGELQQRQSMEATIASVLLQYLNLINFYKSYLINQESVLLSNDRYIRVKESYNYGNISKLEMLNAQVDLSNDSSNLVQSRLDFIKGKSELNQIMGIDPGTDYSIDTTIQIDMNLDMEAFINKALDKNSLYLAQKVSTQSNMQDLKINNAQKLPNLSLSGGYSFSRQDIEAGFITQTENLGWNAGLTLSYNIFNGNRVNRNEQNAKILIENQEINTARIENQVKKDIYNAYEDYEAGKSLIGLRKSNLELAEANYERSVEAFSGGQITGIELREAQLNLLNAKYSLSLQKLQTKIAEVNLYRLSGSLIED